MTKLTDREKDVIRIARSVIHDLSVGYQTKELQEHPVDICNRLSALIGDTYDFVNDRVA